MRSLCTERAWPRGELNLPRALVTEKAFPENEVLLTTTIGGGDAATFDNVLLYERRLGARSQIELAVPLAMQKDGEDTWQHGLGDIAVAIKHALFHSSDSGTIVSAALEILLPTGKETQDLGKGVTIIEPFVAVGQLLPADSFLQFQGGIELPTDTELASKEAFWRLAFGRTFVQNRFGRAWSPTIEIVGARELGAGRWRAVGCGAADAGQPQPPPAHLVQRRRPDPDHEPRGTRRTDPDLFPVGLVRRRPVRWLAVRQSSPSDWRYG